jgi:hypothetical protein
MEELAAGIAGCGRVAIVGVGGIGSGGAIAEAVGFGVKLEFLDSVVVDLEFGWYASVLGASAGRKVVTGELYTIGDWEEPGRVGADVTVIVGGLGCEMGGGLFRSCDWVEGECTTL